MRSIYISLPAEAANRLRDLATRERRSPRQQAAVLVLAGLDRDAEASAGHEQHDRGTDRRAASTTERAR
jgi:hypothetical protein